MRSDCLVHLCSEVELGFCTEMSCSCVADGGGGMEGVRSGETENVRILRFQMKETNDRE